MSCLTSLAFSCVYCFFLKTMKLYKDICSAWISRTSAGIFFLQIDVINISNMVAEMLQKSNIICYIFMLYKVYFDYIFHIYGICFIIYLLYIYMHIICFLICYKFLYSYYFILNLCDKVFIFIICTKFL